MAITVVDHSQPRPSAARKRRGRPTAALIPAAARAPESYTDAELQLSGQAIDTFTKAVGGRDALIEVLSVADAAPEIDRIVTLLLDPRYDGWSLRQICRLAGLTVADLFVAYRKALIARAHIEASRIIAAKLPPIVDDVMTRAIPVAIDCPSCKRQPGVRETCRVCHGSGSVLSEPALERQKLALELGQLTQKSGGLFIQQNQIANASAATLAAGGGGMLEQLQQAVGDLLFRPSRGEAPMTDPPGDPVPVVDEPPTEIPDEDDREEDEDADTELPTGDPPA